MTGAGEALIEKYNYCAKRLRLELDALNLKENTGVLRITTPIDFGSLLMPQLIARLAVMTPETTVLCHTSDEVVDLAKSEWDMAITSVSPAEEADNIIYRSSLYITGSPEYLTKMVSQKRLMIFWLTLYYSDKDRKTKVGSEY